MRARVLSVYGTRSGPAESARKAVTISATAAPMPERVPSSGVTSIATVGRAVGDTEGCYHTSPGTLYLRKWAELPMTLVGAGGGQCSTTTATESFLVG